MRLNAVVVAGGAAVAAVLTAAAGLPAGDAVTLVAISFGVAALADVAGRAVLPWVQRWSGDAAAAVVVALVPVVGMVAGALAAARAMFVSTHDLQALLVIVAGASTAGVLRALALARQLAAARREADAALARVQQLDSSRRELVAWVSHDLRTPLAAARAMVEALDDGVVSDEATVRRYHRQMGQEVDRLAALVDDLFELSCIEADALRLDLEPLPVGDVVGDAVSRALVLAAARRVRIETIGEPSLLVRGSAPELTRVLSNLLDNAIRHTPAGGVVRVRLGRETAGAVVVDVRDQCGGIPDHDLPRVFEPAYRGDTARTAGGGGLGLAIARGLVEAHDGDIDVLNAGDGCCFTVRLPAAAASR